MSKKLESNAEFVHILYLHKLSEEFLQKEKSIKTSTEYVYDVLTRGFLFNRSNPEPLVLSESIVSKYGIDNLVANLQRKFRNNFNVIVCKVPQEFMRLEYSYGDTRHEDVRAKTNEFKALPMCYRKQCGDKLHYYIAPQYIESVYLGAHGDYGRVINESWQPVIEDSLGMFFDLIQKERFKINNDWEILQREEKKLDYCRKNQLTSEQLSFAMKCNPELLEEFGDNQALAQQLKEKYEDYERILNKRMSPARIEALLLSDSGKAQTKKRISHIKEQM